MLTTTNEVKEDETRDAFIVHQRMYTAVCCNQHVCYCGLRQLFFGFLQTNSKSWIYLRRLESVLEGANMSHRTLRKVMTSIYSI
jgi:hypothetical protein